MKITKEAVQAAARDAVAGADKENPPILLALISQVHAAFDGQADHALVAECTRLAMTEVSRGK